MYEYVGLGDAQTTQIVGVISSTGAAVAGQLLIPIPGVGAAIGAAVGLLINTLFKPNIQKIQASNDANQIEQILKQNLANWLSIPPNQRYKSVQTAALYTFDQGWSKYTQAVQPLLNKAPNSISDRQEGSCAYHTAQPAGWDGDTYIPNGPNQPTGSCWNWFIGYRDPISNDPNVIPDPLPGQSVAGGIDQILSIGSGSDSSLLFLAGALILGGLIVSQT